MSSEQPDNTAASTAAASDAAAPTAPPAAPLAALTSAPAPVATPSASAAPSSAAAAPSAPPAAAPAGAAPAVPAPGGGASSSQSRPPAAAPAATPAPPQESLLSKFERQLNQLGREFQRGVNTTQRKLLEKLTEKEFQQLYQVSDKEHLLAEHSCRALTQGGSLPGFVYLTGQRLCFFSDATRNRILVAIPFADVVNVQKGLFVPSAFANTPSEVLPCKDDDDRADVIQVFTRDMKIHQFASFVDFGKAYHLLHWTWRIFSIYSPPVDL